MSNITSIQSGHAHVRPSPAEPRAPTDPAPAPHDDARAKLHIDRQEASNVPSSRHLHEGPAAEREEIVAAVEDLRDAMSRLPGSAREVNLLYRQEEQTYLIEIRNKETGEVLQTFPPENLLNLSRRSADLLGVLIDRQG